MAVSGSVFITIYVMLLLNFTVRLGVRVWLNECLVVSVSLVQSHCLLPKLQRPPEFGSFQKIAQNFCAVFKLTLWPSSPFVPMLTV